MTEIIVALFILLGAGFIFISALGLLRFNDLYSRMHATTKATSFGILLLIIGVGLYFNQGIVWIKAILVVAFLYLTAPLAAHSIAKSLRDKKEERD